MERLIISMVEFLEEINTGVDTILVLIMLFFWVIKISRFDLSEEERIRKYLEELNNK